MESVHNGPTAGTVAPPQPQVDTAVDRPVERPPVRPKQSKPTLYDKAGISFAYAASGVLSIALWYAGAYFTIAALRAFGIDTTNPAWWILPVAITAIEIWLMPRTGFRWQAVSFFSVVLLLDVLSSWYGVVATLGGRFLPLGSGWTIPKDGIILQVAAIFISLIFAFMPERLARWSLAELWKVWR